MIRSRRYRKHWHTLVSMYGSRCFYCGEEPATTIDHVVPASWDNDDSLENLVPACMWCNTLAGDKMFSDVYAKRAYIVSVRRRKRKKRRCICTECLLPFVYKEHSPSPFLCPECYDIEYETKQRNRKSWRNWLGVLEQAGIMLEAHRMTGDRVRALVVSGTKVLTDKQRVDILIGIMDEMVGEDHDKFIMERKVTYLCVPEATLSDALAP